MTNYLIRHITDSTNHTFVEVIKPRENECYEIVSAENKAEAKRKVNRYVLEIDGALWEGTKLDLISILNKYTALVDSEECPLNIRLMPIDQYKTMKYKKGQ